ncbi:MAG: aminoglycoside phosphotransferase family protein [Vampirovibrio sp.]|nr:aminoglycoside phosphotransferase family protein [Vampirovibrio sp.]
MTKVLLIPSAKLIPVELQMDFGAIPSAMIPLESQPVLKYIASPYVRQDYQPIVAVHEHGDQVVRYVEKHPELQTKAVDVGSTKSLGETVLNALSDTLDKTETIVEHLLINFADTFVGDALPAANFIAYHRQSDVYRWTTFEFSPDHLLKNLADKNREKEDLETIPVFVGVFGITDVSRFYQCLQRQVEAHQPGELDPFYQALKIHFNTLASTDKAFIEVQEWHDFGHLDTYHATKKNLYLNKRHFNEVDVDARRGIVRKSSTNVQKFIHEINWYLRLPKKMNYIAPRIFDYSLDVTSPFVEMEFYGYPPLNDVYMFGDCDAGVWRQIFQSIDCLIEEMGQYKLQPHEPRKLTDAMHEMYIQKTVKRLDGIVADPDFVFFTQKNVLINGQTCMGLKEVLAVLPEMVERLNLYGLDSFHIIHGDLCLSNILYDRRNRIIRVIDPRGTFGEFDIYGDPRYDLAKLSHSLEGDYDFIVNGLFESDLTDNAYTFRPFLDERHLTIKEMFWNEFMKKRQARRSVYEQIKFIESLLFLSMVPLHSDRPASQAAFLARGLQIFTDIFQKNLQEATSS